MISPSAFARHRGDSSGIALVIVLAFLALIAVFIVAFFSTVQTDMTTSRSYADGVAARELVASANQLAIGQINDATKSVKVPRADGATTGINAGGRLAWASQPGAIRTWDDTGAGWKLFKLYSARDMVVDISGAAYVTKDRLPEEVPDTWVSSPALYTDLNSPVLVADTEGTINRDGQKLRASYPIVDPLGVNFVDGFEIAAPPGYGGPLDPGSGNPKISDSYDPYQPGTPLDSGKTGNPAAMPVAWMYVLKDGTLTVPTGSRDNGRTATWTGADPSHTPSRENPIVGRVAFWTDDESCKLNLNTASEPTPWDTPRGISIQDLNYGKFQPGKGEFQRFPGHPFMSALSPVLLSEKVRGLTPITAAQKDSIYGLIPRVAAGGTTGGTKTAVSVATDDARLFANVDEFLFDPQRTDVATDPANRSLSLNKAKLRSARFFLTANSRAPELNLFGQPRISLWPVHKDPAKRTAYDKLAAFCSTIGDPNSPGGGGYSIQRADSKSPTADYDGIVRNRDLYAYLKNLTGNPIPGYGGSFLGKWKTDRDQVLTEVFDYIRCVNLRDTQKGATVFADSGQVTPLVIGDTKGFGRFHTISQFGFHFICSQDGANGAVERANPALPAGQRAIEAAFILEPFSPSLGWYPITEDLSFEVKFVTPFNINGQNLMMQSGIGSMTNGSGAPGMFHSRKIGGSAGIRAPIASFGGGSYKFVSKATPRVRVPGGGTMTFSGGTVEVKVYTGSGGTGPLVQKFTLDFPGGQIPVPSLVPAGTTPYRGAAAKPTAWWWTFNGYQPLTGAPGAREPGRYSGTLACPHAPGPEYTDPKRRFINSGGSPGFKEGGVFRAEDVVRAIVPVHGDIRLIAAMPEVTATQFGKVRDDLWENPSTKFLHIFQAVTGPHHHFGFSNEPGPSPAAGIPGAAADDQLFGSANVPMHYSRLPEIRPGAGKKYNRWGDFDNSMATWVDGAYINKPDEGNLSASQAVGGISYPYFSWTFSASTETYFSPSRLIPSAGMFGSLPTGVKRTAAALQLGSGNNNVHAWETLLFRPEVRKPGGVEHPGAVTPKDHLIMDLFWMPVIEPYAISEPFSTAGKVNLNYEIVPFNYIRRTTALHGAMKSEEPLAFINAASRIYKLWDHETNDHPNLPNSPNNQDPVTRAEWDKAAKGQAPFDKMRRPIDVAQTLSQAEDRFNAGNIFRSATEICELHLVRRGETLSEYQNPLSNFWQNHLITGDNTRERPYTNLYAKLTTRSNTFTVHVRVQALRKAYSQNADDWAVWREGRDQQVSEYRGSTTIERYIDAADRNLPDFAKDPNAVADRAYKFRVLATKKFSP